jgi:hypothetical protein
MALWIYYLIFAFLIIGGGIATVMIGFSNKNKEGNPGYDKQTASIFKGLSLYYAVSIPLGLLALAVYVVRFVF